MSNATITDTNYFDGVNWDMPSIRHPLIEQLQNNAKKAQLLAFDEDVVNWVAKQDSDTRQRINEMLRQVMGIHRLA